jgi:hypothetical protein
VKCALHKLTKHRIRIGDQDLNAIGLVLGVHKPPWTPAALVTITADAGNFGGTPRRPLDAGEKRIEFIAAGYLAWLYAGGTSITRKM